MSAGMGIAITVALLAVNAFFVAGEFAVTSTRRSQVEPLADEGARGTRDALYALQHVSLMLAICQLGVTVASTTLGVVAEPAIAHLVESPLERLGAPEATSHVIGFAAALIIVLFCHVVFGEMVPKNISIAAPVRMLLILAPILVRLGHVLRPIIEAMDHFATGSCAGPATSRARKSPPPTRLRKWHPRVASQAEGVLTDELGLLSGTLEFSEETAGSAMVPLDDLVVLPRRHPRRRRRARRSHRILALPDRRRGRRHRRLRPPQGRPVRLRRGTRPADHAVAHSPPRVRFLLRPGRGRPAPHAAHRRPLRSRARPGRPGRYPLPGGHPRAARRRST